jgi:hypothetical protein
MARPPSTLDDDSPMLGFQPSLALPEDDLKRDKGHPEVRRSLQCLVAPYHFDDEKL